MIVSHIEHTINVSAVAASLNADGANKQSDVNGEENTAVLTLCDNGTIFECNNAAGALLDCVPSKITWQHISTILPQLEEIALMQGEKINPNLRFLSRIGYTFEVVSVSGTHFTSAVFFNEVETFGRHFLRIILRPVLLEQAAS
jgi:hypothetical protein